MSILIDDGSRVLVQGITGREGEFHTERMIRYGTRVVGGVTPGRGESAYCDAVYRIPHSVNGGFA